MNRMFTKNSTDNSIFLSAPWTNKQSNITRSAVLSRFTIWRDHKRSQLFVHCLMCPCKYECVWNGPVLHGARYGVRGTHTLLSLCSFIMRVLTVGWWSLTAQSLEELLIIKSSQPLQPLGAPRAQSVDEEPSRRMRPPMSCGCHMQL